MKIVFQSLSQTCFKTQSSRTYSNNRTWTCERKAANGMVFSLEWCKHTFEQQAGCVSLPASAVHPLKNEILQSFRYYDLGMGALGTVCTWNTNGIMIWAWMLWEHERNYDLGMDALGAVCSWNTNGIMIWAWVLWEPYALGTRTEFMIWAWVLWEPVCSWNTNGIMIWAWMLWEPYALGTRTEL